MKLRILLFLLLTAISVQIMAEPNTGPIANDIRIINSLIQAGEIQRALNYLGNAEKTHGRSQPILSLYKQIYKAGKLYDKFEEVVLEDLSSDPKNSLIKIELGEAKYLLENYAAADSIWNTVLKSDSKNQAVYTVLAGIKLRYGQSEDAIEIFLRGRRELADPALFAEELAGIYTAQRNYPRAVEEYMASLKNYPERFGFVANEIRGMVADSDNPQEIIDVINRQVDKSPDQDYLYEILGEIHIKQNQMGKALEGYRMAGRKRNDDGLSLVNFAGRCIEVRSFQTAIEAINEYFNTSIKKAQRDKALYIKAVAYSEQNQINQSLECLKELLLSSKDMRTKDQANFLCGKIFAYKNGDCDSALMTWSRALPSIVDMGLGNEMRVEMALCYLRLENITEAEKILVPMAESGEVNRFNEKAQFLLGDIALYNGRLSESEVLLKALSRQYPQGEFTNDALMRLNALATLKGDSANTQLIERFAQAMKAEVIGEFAKEGDLLSADIIMDSRIGEMAGFLAASAYQKARLDDKARGLFEKYISQYQDGIYSDRAYLGIGDILAKNKNTIPQARAAYSKILEQYSGGTVTELARERILKLDSQEKIG